jgi:hypothetical protein
LFLIVASVGLLVMWDMDDGIGLVRLLFDYLLVGLFIIMVGGHTWLLVG